MFVSTVKAVCFLFADGQFTFASFSNKYVLYTVDSVCTYTNTDVIQYVYTVLKVMFISLEK